jgi:type IV pilus assembly protein PilF
VPKLAAISGYEAEMPAPDLKKAALINVELGLGYLGQGQVARAKNKLTHAVKLAPELPETHSAMAHFQEMVGDNVEAEKSHKKSIKEASNKGAFYNNYGVFLCRQKRYKEADEIFQNALNDKDYDHSAEVYENAGICALKWPNNEKARTYLEAAVRRDPSRTNAMLELAGLNLNQGQIQKVNELLGRYKTVAEPSARSLWLGIQAAKANNDIESQETQILLLKNLFEDSPEYQSYLKMSGLKTDHLK